MAQHLKKLEEPIAKLLEKGINCFISLAERMKEAMELRRYAEKMSHMTRVLESVNEHLSETEQKVVELLNQAYKKSIIAAHDAVTVISAIKSHINALLVILSESGPGSDKQKMLTACKHFTKYASTIETKVRETEIAWRDACIQLQEAQNVIGGIVGTLEEVHDRAIETMKAEEAKQRGLAYGTAAVGVLAGPFGPLISFAIAAGITEGITIPNLQAEFERQRQTVSANIESFQQMQIEAKRLQDQISDKNAELIDIKERLSTLGTLTGSEDILTNEDTSEVVLHTIRKLAKELVEACETFLTTGLFATVDRPMN